MRHAEDTAEYLQALPSSHWGLIKSASLRASSYKNHDDLVLSTVHIQQSNIIYNV